MTTTSVMIAVVLALLPGCAPLLAGTTDPGKIAAIMQATNAAGCIYTRASASPWASVTTILVGAWGEPRPSLEECWRQLPTENP